MDNVYIIYDGIGLVHGYTDVYDHWFNRICEVGLWLISTPLHFAGTSKRCTW